jgi:hypothetical protein
MCMSFVNNIYNISDFFYEIGYANHEDDSQKHM